MFTPIAFAGIMDFNTLVLTMATQAVVKTIYEVLFLPVTYLVAKKVDEYEKRME